MSDRLGDSCGLLMSSNSLELLLKIGIFDFLSPCFVGLALVSGDMNFARILGGFINEILGVLCSGSSCSLLARSALLLIFAGSSGNGTSSFDLPSDFSRFVRSLFDVVFSIVSFALLSPMFSMSFVFTLFSHESSSFAASSDSR